MHKTEAGVILPGRKAVTIINDDWKKIRRALTVFEHASIRVMLVCKDCEKVLEAEDSPGGLILRCECTDRTIWGGSQ